MIAQWLDGAQGYRNHEREQGKTWVTIVAERVLYVARGRDVIVCDRQLGHEIVEIVVKLTPAAVAALRAALQTET